MAMDMDSTIDRRISGAISRQAGFGLVELMISITIGLVMLAALVALFVNSSRNNREMATANSVIENGRFAIELLESDIVHAGYWGTYVPDFDDPTRDEAAPTSTPTGVPALCEAFVEAAWVTGTATVNNLIGIPIQAFESDTAVCPDPGVLEDAVPGTDVIVLRHAERCAPGVGSCDADDPANPELFIQASLCDEEAPDDPYAFGLTDAAPFDPPFTLMRRSCDVAEPAEKRRFVSYIYYVRNYLTPEGVVIPTLVRSEFDLVGGVYAYQQPVQLIEGIDGLWVEFGVDNVSITGDLVDNTAAVEWEDEDTKERATNRGDGSPDGDFIRCEPCDDADALMNVTAAKIYVLARSREPTVGYTDAKTYLVGQAGEVGPFDDGFKRHVYSTTVRLPNVSGRRERP